MLRALVVVLLLANAAFYAWTQGWLDAAVGMRAIGDREPERLARQVRPELIVISPAASAGEPGPSVLACLEAGPFGDADLAAAQAAAQAALPDGSFTTARTEQPGAWIVYMGRYADRTALTSKAEELKRRNLPFDEVRDDAALAPGLSLGRFDRRAAADDALTRFAQQGVRTARVVEVQKASASNWLRVDKADPALEAKLAALKPEALGKGFGPCDAQATRN